MGKIYTSYDLISISPYITIDKEILIKSFYANTCSEIDTKLHLKPGNEIFKICKETLLVVEVLPQRNQKT